tara:strand:+ start:1429 stop:1914 length:486 start_codon:yes stop_codon:yes gene_type:complete
MPNYDYHCETCGHTHSVIVHYEERETHRLCPQCSCTARYQFPVDAVNGITVFEPTFCEPLGCDVSGYNDMVNKAKLLGYEPTGDKVRGGRNEETFKGANMVGPQKPQGISIDDRLRERQQKADLKENWSSYAQSKGGGETKVKETKNLKKAIKVKHLTQNR